MWIQHNGSMIPPVSNNAMVEARCAMRRHPAIYDKIMGQPEPSVTALAVCLMWEQVREYRVVRNIARGETPYLQLVKG